MLLNKSIRENINFLNIPIGYNNKNNRASDLFASIIKNLDLKIRLNIMNFISNTNSFTIQKNNINSIKDAKILIKIYNQEEIDTNIQQIFKQDFSILQIFDLDSNKIISIKINNDPEFEDYDSFYNIINNKFFEQNELIINRKNLTLIQIYLHNSKYLFNVIDINSEEIITLGFLDFDKNENNKYIKNTLFLTLNFFKFIEDYENATKIMQLIYNSSCLSTERDLLVFINKKTEIKNKNKNYNLAETNLIQDLKMIQKNYINQQINKDLFQEYSIGSYFTIKIQNSRSIKISEFVAFVKEEILKTLSEEVFLIKITEKNLEIYPEETFWEYESSEFNSFFYNINNKKIEYDLIIKFSSIINNKFTVKGLKF